MGKRKPAFDYDMIYRLDADGYTASEIAEMVGAKSNYHIRELIRNHRREIDPNWRVCRGRSRSQKEEEKAPLDAGKVRALYRAGWSLPKIYNEFYGAYPMEKISEVLAK